MTKCADDMGSLDVLLIAAKDARPQALMPPEPELAEPPPRTAHWVRCDKGTHENLSLFRTAAAFPGWVLSVEDKKHGIGDPDYTIVFAYEKESVVILASSRMECDLMHWELGQPDSYRWFQRNMKTGKPVTVLVSDDGTARIYGLLDPYITKDDCPIFAAGEHAGSH
jgi:hypothetical protein